MSDDRVGTNGTNGSYGFYGTLAPWWPLISPVDDYASEAAYIEGLLSMHARQVTTVLELGSGGGHIAHHLSKRFTMTLTDLSPDMLAVSQHLNPDCRHLHGDMRTVRLDGRFDAVLIHDAIDYMTTESDLASALATAAAHVLPGGVVVIVPDHTTENFFPDSDVGGIDATDPADGRGVRFLDWTWDPDPYDTWIQTEYSFIMRGPDGTITTAHESHRTGLFPERTWLRLLEEAGLRASAFPEVTTDDRPPRTVFIGVADGA